jgi:hypothetical protein
LSSIAVIAPRRRTGVVWAAAIAADSRGNAHNDVISRMVRMEILSENAQLLTATRHAP